MSFDSHSLDRLRELGRKLPKSLSSPAQPEKTESKATQRRHIVETEDKSSQEVASEIINLVKG